MAYVDRRGSAAAVSQTLRDYVHIESGRIDWVDYLKGFCILLVVMLHSVTGVEQAFGQVGWMHPLVEVSQPMRMPAFFLASGLFFMRSVDKPLGSFLDTKILHFAYFYTLWLTIQFALKSPGYVAEMGALETVKYYFWSFVEPMGTLWFIHMLAVFFVVTKVLEPLLPKLTVWRMAAFFHSMHVKTGFLPIDEFTSRFVFFYSGYVAAPYVFRFAEGVAKRSMLALVCGLYIWASMNGWFVFNGYAELPGVSLFLGFAGIGAVVAVSQILVQTDWLRFVRYCGENSIVIVFLRNFIGRPPWTATPSKRFKKSVWNIVRRNSPSVTPSKPSSSWSATASRMHLSSTARSSSSEILPSWWRFRALRSSVGRNKEPT